MQNFTRLDTLRIYSSIKIKNSLLNCISFETDLNMVDIISDFSLYENSFLLVFVNVRVNVNVPEKVLGIEKGIWQKALGTRVGL